MFCISCGTELPDGANFCLKCGKPQQNLSATNSELRQQLQYHTERVMLNIKVIGAGWNMSGGMVIDQDTERHINTLISERVKALRSEGLIPEQSYAFVDLSRAGFLNYREVKSLFGKWGSGRDFMLESVNIRFRRSVLVTEEQAKKVAEIEAKTAKTSFDVVLASIGRNTINVIKAVREETGLGLKEAKDLTERAPVVIKHTNSRAEAESIRDRMLSSGATIDIR